MISHGVGAQGGSAADGSSLLLAVALLRLVVVPALSSRGTLRAVRPTCVEHPMDLLEESEAWSRGQRTRAPRCCKLAPAGRARKSGGRVKRLPGPGALWLHPRRCEHRRQPVRGK